MAVQHLPPNGLAGCQPHSIFLGPHTVLLPLNDLEPEEPSTEHQHQGQQQPQQQPIFALSKAHLARQLPFQGCSTNHQDSALGAGSAAFSWATRSAMSARRSCNSWISSP